MHSQSVLFSTVDNFINQIQKVLWRQKWSKSSFQFIVVFAFSQYLRLLERFEILLSLEDGKFLIPCMLSEEKPDIEDKMFHVITSEEIRDHQINVERTSNYLTRNYHMQYVPAGFWARLIGKRFYLIFSSTAKIDVVPSIHQISIKARPGTQLIEI